MCKIDRKFKDNLYKNDDPIQAKFVYKGILESYLLIHTNGTIAVFKHRRKNQDCLVWNVVKPFDDGHSHFRNLQVARIIADNIALDRKPKRDMCLRNLASYHRIANESYKYLDWVSNLMEVKIDKKLNNNKFYKVSKAV